MAEEGESFRESLAKLRAQLECTRRLEQIEADLREMRAEASKARLAQEGEEGFVPRQWLEDDRWFVVPTEETSARSSAVQGLVFIEQRLDEFISDLSVYKGSLFNLAWHLDTLQRNIRLVARQTAQRSLNELTLSVNSLTQEVHEMLLTIRWENEESNQAERIEHEKEHLKRKAQEPQWVSDKRESGKLPIPD